MANLEASTESNARELPSQRPAYSLQDIFDTLASSLRFEEVLDRILTVSLRELCADQGSLLLLHGVDNSELKMLASRGLPEQILRRGYVPRKGSISEYVLRERRPIIINDVPRTDHFETMAADTTTLRTIYSALCVPVIARGTVLGTMNLNRTRFRHEFTQQELETASIIAGQAAIVIENRRLQEELLQKERLAAIGEVVAGISHCIKNILSGVKGGLGITEMGINQNRIELIRDGFDLLKRSSGTLSNLVLDLLDYSKDRQPFRDVFSVPDMLRNVLRTVDYRARTFEVKIACDFPAGEFTFFGDQDQIFRSVLNLVTNAIEACSEVKAPERERAVKVTWYTASAHELSLLQNETGKIDQWLVIEVADNGPGIPEEKRDVIWNLFYSTKGSRGTGIGLAATRKMVEEHGGRILLDSTPGQGTTFRVLLPIVPEPQRRERK